MTNWTALILAALILAVVGADQILNAGAGAFFLVQKFILLLEWVIFWR